uniref:Peptidase M14 domain-containing protein n=1 Tax=Glossina brevipalpis TaxID=37001 RepID=A0A1A9WBX1_9MUSC
MYIVWLLLFQSLIAFILVTTNVNGLEWTQYHNLDEIYEWSNELEDRFSPFVTVYTMGYSYEKRPIKAIKISSRSGNQAIFIESSIHAIEWISSAVSTCFFNNLLNSNDTNLQDLLLHYDWFLVPVMNPDGFVYTHEVNRWWRKNRKPTGVSNATGPCYGTDLNRNFNYEWSKSGYQINDPCDHWYHGAAPDTEPEILALQNFINGFPDNYIRLYLALHSYGNFVLLPYGHTIEIFPPNYDQMMRIAQGFAEAALVRYNTTFKYGASGLLNYSGYVSGDAKDWAYGMKNIPFAATIELRDSGHYGFLLPADQIIEVCNEFTDGMVGLIKAAEKETILIPKI